MSYFFSLVNRILKIFEYFLILGEIFVLVLEGFKEEKIDLGFELVFVVFLE